MSGRERDVPDAPACPFLGLATDPRSHFTFAHPEHRCFAADRPDSVDPRRQGAYCLSSDFPACEHYLARLSTPSDSPPR